MSIVTTFIPEAEPCLRTGFPVAPLASMLRFSATTTAILSGLTVTLLQLALAVLLLAPEGPLGYRYQTLIQHDSYWFMNIVDRGYQTIVPPISHKMLEVSNVAFFPAYPIFAGALKAVLRLSTANALLLAAHLAAWAFWSYFFLFAQRWNVAPSTQWLGAASIAAHPGAFFLIAAYSESLFLGALLGFLFWTASESKRGQILGALHGVVMSATRIVGLPCALAPIVWRAAKGGWRGRREVRQWPRYFLPVAVVAALAMLGGLGFFLYGQYRWGHWDIYMMTQQFGWAIEPDYLAVFKPSSYHWLIPSLSNPTEMSQMAMTVGAILLVSMGVLELRAGLGRDPSQATRFSILFAAAVIFFISVSGVACVAMESMLRYEFCVHALIVLAFIHYLANVPVRLWLGRAGAIAALALLCLAGVALQGWYIWNFTRGNWVA